MKVTNSMSRSVKVF